eukprot:1793844-Rhodomonas_salina.1
MASGGLARAAPESLRISLRTHPTLPCHTPHASEPALLLKMLHASSARERREGEGRAREGRGEGGRE